MSLPRIVVGTGPETVVVINGGNAFVGRFDERRAERDAARLGRLFPEGTRLCVIGYDPGMALPVDVATLAAQVGDIVRSDFRGATIAGVSFGGLLGLRLANQQPDLVDRLILLSAAHRFSPEGARRVTQQIAALECGDLDAMMQPFLSLFRRPWMNLLMRATVRLRRRTIQQRMNRPELIAGLLTAALDESGALSAALPTMRTPTLVVAGTRDQFFGDGAFEATATALPVSTLVRLPGETHMVLLERPRQVRDAVTAFLAR